MEDVIKQSEYQEQCNLVEYLELKGLKFSKIAQDTYAKGWSTKIKNKKSGVRKGLPDLLIILPPMVNGYGARLLFIELKTVRGGKLSPEQKEWINELNKIVNVSAHCCKGFDASVELIEQLLGEAPRDL